MCAWTCKVSLQWVPWRPSFSMSPNLRQIQPKADSVKPVIYQVRVDSKTACSPAPLERTMAESASPCPVWLSYNLAFCIQGAPAPKVCFWFLHVHAVLCLPGMIAYLLATRGRTFGFSKMPHGYTKHIPTQEKHDTARPCSHMTLDSACLSLLLFTGQGVPSFFLPPA